MSITTKEYILARAQHAEQMVKEASRGRALRKVTTGMLDDLLTMGRAQRSFTPNAINKGVVTNRFNNLLHEVDAAHDLGVAASKVTDYMNKASLNRKSIRNSYSDLFNTQSETNPLQLLRSAKKTVYDPLGSGYMHAGSSLKDVAHNEVEHMIVNTLAKRADNPEVVNYAKKLVAENTGPGSELKLLTKKVIRDFEEGIDPIVNVPNAAGRGTSLDLKVDTPLTTFGGSPTFDLKKTFGVANLDDLNRSHQKLVDDWKEAYNKFGQSASETQIAAHKAQYSDLFRQRFGNKLQDAHLPGRAASKPRFSLDDVSSAEDATLFFGNPMAQQGVNSLPPDRIQGLQNEMVHSIQNAAAIKGNSPQVIKSAIINKLDEFSRNPDKAGFLDTFHLARYTNSEMKDIVDMLRSTKSAPSQEVLRLVSDAGVGLFGLGAAGMYGYKKYKEKSNRNREKY